MPAMKKLKLSIAAKISRAWPAPTVLLYLIVGSDAPASRNVGALPDELPRRSVGTRLILGGGIF